MYPKDLRKDLLIFLKDLLNIPKDLPVSLCNSLRTSVSFFKEKFAGLQDLHYFQILMI